MNAIRPNVHSLTSSKRTSTVFCRLLQLLQTLNATDRITLTEEANRRGFTLDETSIKESRQCYSDIIREIRESQY
ncbi:hypothetical protein BIY29_06630 [Brenneria alni]|uniref:Uncharacterized protein n=1 Tax=Brenneria alni TaxID=71656 RepID=A0A421DQF0_9GAMM|nr:hypothetical protein [Brenneria alni]RLM25738.1 hypothetical protein BIY29_06630 [Brenneria alni]